MKISIAMATYNGAKYLQEQLDSFVVQTRLPNELVVCDDGSTDKTMDILKQFKKDAPFSVHVYHNDVNIGYINNFEKALSLCTGDLVFLSDQDDVWKPDKISTVLLHHDNNPKFPMIVNDAMYVDEQLNSSNVTVLQKALSFDGKKTAHIAGACTSITKTYLKFLLPFPERSCPGHDVYLHRWAKLLNNKLVLEDILQVWRIHNSNTTRSEMAHPEIISRFTWFKKFYNIDATIAYMKIVDEFEEMKLIIDNRRDKLLPLLNHMSPELVKAEIEKLILAHRNRARLVSVGLISRMFLIVNMLNTGQYRYFAGFKSALKDLLR